MNSNRKTFLLASKAASNTTTKTTAGETGQTGPEAPGDINRGHPEQTDTKDKTRKDCGKG